MSGRPDRFVTLGWSLISWIEHYLVHGPGDVQGQPVELDDEFAAFILKAYRLDPKTGARMVRRAFLSRAKGRSKSGLAAFIACLEALGPARFDHWAEPGEVSRWGYEYQPGEPVGAPLKYVEALCVATEEGQAGNTYDGIYYMLHPTTCSDELRADYPGIDVGLTRVILPDARGTIEPLSSGDTSKDGGKSSFIVADETHLWILPRLKSMHATMARNLLKRKIASGWMLETSTMYGQSERSVAEGTHEYAQSAKPGSRAAESLLFDHHQASLDWDLTDRSQRIEALREAYGPAVAWMDLEALADAWDDPQVTESEFRRYWLNQPVSTEAVPETVFGPAWPACEVTMPEGLPMAGLALAGTFDLDRLAIVGSAIDGDIAHVKPLQSGPGVDWVVPRLVEIQREHDVPVLVDPKGPAAVLLPELERAGVKVRVPESKNVYDACAGIVEAARTGRLGHGGYPELDREVAVAKKRGVGDRWAWDRKQGIPNLEAATLALWAADEPVIEETRESAYASRGVLVV